MLYDWVYGLYAVYWELRELAERLTAAPAFVDWDGLAGRGLQWVEETCWSRDKDDLV